MFHMSCRMTKTKDLTFVSSVIQEKKKEKWSGEKNWRKNGWKLPRFVKVLSLQLQEAKYKKDKSKEINNQRHENQIS